MKTRSLFSILSAFLILSACSGEEDLAPPLIEVVVTEVNYRPYQQANSFVGRLEAAQDVTIQAKVSGYLKKRYFEEGQEINKGDKLYSIDPATFKASKEQAEADIESATAKKKVAKRNYERGQQLIESGVISASQMDELEGKYFEAKAGLKASEAIYDNAKINFDDSTIEAPINGQIGRSKYYVGDLIGPDSGALTTIVNTKTVNAVFSINQKLLLEIHTTGLEADNLSANNVVEVLIKLSDESVYPHKGALDYLDNRIDEGTGTVRVSATIPNPEYLLRHGQYVRVIVQAVKAVEALMIPQATVQSDQSGDFVLVVTKENTISRKNVTLGDRVQENVIVNSGLSQSQRVVLQGIQKVRVGQTVKARLLEQPVPAPIPVNEGNSSVEEENAVSSQTPTNS